MKPHVPQQTVVPRYSALQITTVPRGQAVPLLYGTNKITGQLIWANDFHNIKVTTPAPHVNAGKGFGGGGGGKSGAGQGSSTYYFFASLMWALCEGPIYYLVALRNGSNWVFFDGGPSSPPVAWPVVVAPGTTTPSLGQSGFEAAPILGNNAGVTTGFTASYPWQLQNYDRGQLSAAEANFMVNTHGEIAPTNNSGYQYDGTHFDHIPNSDVYAAQPITLQYGIPFQAPPPYITQKHPEQALSYHFTATIFSYSYQLGQTATPPTLEAWVMGTYCYDPKGITTGGVSIIDAEPTDIMRDLITDPIHGLGESETVIDESSWAQFRNYTVSSGLFLSAVIQGQQQVSQIMQMMLTQVVATSWWSEGRLKLGTWYDRPVTGYGKSFTPNTSIVYNLDSRHFIAGSGKGPLQMTRTAVSDTYNQYSINFSNRNLNYSTDTATVDDLGNQILFGVRPAPPVQGQYIADPSVAFASAILQMQHALYTRRTFTFELPHVFCLLEPFDIVTLTDTEMAVNLLPVRIQAINLTKDKIFQVTATEIPDEIHTPLVRNQQYSSLAGLGTNLQPGPVDPPTIFTAPTHLTGGDLEIWIAVCGTNDAWGGCRVWLSSDNAHYSTYGELRGGSRYGYVTNNIFEFIPSALTPNPDNADVLSVHIFGQNLQINSVTPTQAAQGLTISAVFKGGDAELLSYTTATLTSPDNYNLSGLYRALAGSTAPEHNTGDPFVVLDSNIFRIPIHTSQIGQTYYAKFTSFNQVGGMEQDISKVTAYPFVIEPFGLSAPLGPTNFIASLNGSLVHFTWTEDDSPEVVGYEIRFDDASTTALEDASRWEHAVALVRGISATHSVNAICPPGKWLFWLNSYDKQNRYSLAPTSCFLDVPVMFNVIQEQNLGAVGYHPLTSAAVLREDWFEGGGAVFTNCFVHPTSYALVPTDQALASSNLSADGVWNSRTNFWNDSTIAWDITGSDDWSWVNEMVVLPYATSTWIEPASQAGNTTPTTLARLSAAIYPVLWAFQSLSDETRTITYDAASSGWSNCIFNHCFVHPTAYVLVPDTPDFAGLEYPDIVNTWNSAAAVWNDPVTTWNNRSDTQYAVFDQFNQNPYPDAFVTLYFAFDGPLPMTASFAGSMKAATGQSNSPTPPTVSIASSTDNIYYGVEKSGQGNQKVTVIASEVRVKMQLDTTVNALNVGINLSGNIVVGPVNFQPNLLPWLSTSNDNVTYTPFANVSSLQYNTIYSKTKITWKNTGIPWPFYIASAWHMVDGEAYVQHGSVQGTTIGVSVSFRPSFRATPIFTADIIGGPVGATVGVGSVTIDGAQSIQCYNAAGTPIAGLINWSALGL